MGNLNNLFNDKAMEEWKRRAEELKDKGKPSPEERSQNIFDPLCYSPGSNPFQRETEE